MTDYGHELRFGSFITPTNQQPDDVVGLAVASEAAGLDLVTFQDHPYQAGFLDTWTLLSFVAAQTEKVRLSGNVLSLPLRPPAVLARAAASLDLLSHGRFELGLGAGAFWDGIASMGGQKLAPGEAVTAIEEALDIIHGIWDAGTAGGVRVHGQFHQVDGARRGPLPAHRIETWLGAYKPRMLKLIGRKADGWLPSMSYIKSPTIPESNGLIDAAAAEAGRDPREIRRLLNLFGIRLDGSAEREEAVATLTGLALAHGFSTFIQPSDDPGTLRAFGEEVAPRVRDKVAAARAKAGVDTRAMRSVAARGKRRDGIDYAAIPPRLAAGAVEPGDHEYPLVRSTYIHHGRPGLVLRPQDAGGVSEAVRYATDQQVPLAVRSGGHGISGRSTNDGGIVIDLGALNRVELLDAATGRVRIGAGARWGEVAEALAPHGLGMSSGDYGDVGVGGLATAGGIGWLGRKHGLTIDHVVAADVVLADGRQVRVDAAHEPELFWGLRGAGGNFGIVTAVELEAYPVGNVVFATLAFDATDTTGLLIDWSEKVIAAPRALTSFMMLGPGRRGQPPIGQAMIVIADENVQQAEQLLTSFLDCGPLIGSQAHLMPYPALVAPHPERRHDGQGGMVAHNAMINSVTPGLGDGIGAMLQANVAQMVQLRATGGAVNDVAADATAFAHRHQSFNLSAVSHESRRVGFDGIWNSLPDRDGLYLSFESDFSDALLAQAFPGATLERLRRLKAQVDPYEVFSGNFPIPPMLTASAVAE